MYELKLRNGEKLQLLAVGILIFKYNNDELHDAFKGMFSYRHEIYVHNDKGTHQLHTEQLSPNIDLKWICCYGAKL